MIESENGFEVSIKLKNYDTFNFCFRNNYNIWDNNFGFNYISPIEEPKQIEENSNKSENQSTENAVENVKNEIIENNIEDTAINNTTTIKNTIEEINNNIDKEIDKIISQILKEPDTINKKEFQSTNEKDYKNENTQTKIEEVSKETANTENTKDKESEKEFNDLLDSILKFDETPKVDVNFENGFGLQSVDEVKEISSIDCDDMFQKLYNNNEETGNSNSSELENLLNALIERQNEQHNYEESEAIDVKELEKLMNNLNSIIEEKNNNINETSDEEETNQSEFKISELPIEQKNSEDFLDNIIDKSYNFFQKIWVGCKKIGTLIKQTAKNLLGEEK